MNKPSTEEEKIILTTPKIDLLEAIKPPTLIIPITKPESRFQKVLKFIRRQK